MLRDDILVHHVQPHLIVNRDMKQNSDSFDVPVTYARRGFIVYALDYFLASVRKVDPVRTETNPPGKYKGIMGM